MIRRRLALSVAVACSILAFGSFFYFGKNHEAENRAYYVATEQAIFATASQRGTTYAAVRASTANCYSHPVIDPEECAAHILYGDNFEGIMRWQRFLQWLELPFDVILAFAAGFIFVYAFVATIHLIRDKWLPWVRGR